jgi:hypothetical protein
MPVPLENAVALGRIGGPLLAENLVRKNTGFGEENLAFHNISDTDNILYLNVIDGKVGINTDNPQSALDVNSAIYSTNYKSTTSATIAKYSISTNRIVNPFAGVNGKIILSPNQTLDPTIQGPRFETVNLGIDDALIENLTLDSNINLNPNGTGQLYVTTKELVVDGDLTVTGKTTWDGSFITIGSDSSDNVIFNADINSHIIPNIDNEYDLGSLLQEWKTTYVTNSHINDTTIGSAGISVDTLIVDGLANLNGEVIIGSDPSDQITFTSLIDSDLIPTDSTYTLGSIPSWNTLFASDLNVDNVIDINNNTITTLTTDNLELIAAGTGKINVTLSDVTITNDLSVGQSTTFNDSVSITGLLNLLGSNTYSLTGNANRTGNTNITGSLTQYGDYTSQFEDIQIYSNTIKTTVGNSDLVLDANGNGIVNFTDDVQIDNNLTVLGDGYLNSVTTTGEIAVGDFYVGDFYISNNDIITTAGSNIDIILGANGNGKVYAPTNDVNITNDLTVTGDVNVTSDTSLKYVEIGLLGNPATLTQTGNIDQTGSTYVTGNLQSASIVIVPASWIESAELKIQGTTISVKTSNTDLILQANGSGGIVFDRQLRIASNVISNIFDINDISLAYNNVLITEDGQLLWLEDESDVYLTDQKNDRNLSVIFEPNGRGNVIIDSDKALAIAYGTAVLESNGEIRQNSIDGVYEGFASSGNVSFTNLYDTDHNTYITAELTPGANDNIIRFGINGSVAGYIDSTKLYSNRLYAGNVRIFGNQITNLTSSNDLEIFYLGNGKVNVNNVSFRENAITNNTNDPIILESTGTGYIKFAGSGGVTFPKGNDVTRAIVPELGQTRYNTQREYVEVYDGNNWIPASGASSAATEEEIQAETNLWAFILG